MVSGRRVLVGIGVDRNKGGPGDGGMVGAFRDVSCRNTVEEAICSGCGRAPAKDAVVVGGAIGLGCEVTGESIVVAGGATGLGWEVRGESVVVIGKTIGPGCAGADGDPAGEFILNDLWQLSWMFTRTSATASSTLREESSDVWVSYGCEAIASTRDLDAA